MKRAVIYLRTAAQEQRGTSHNLDTQVAACRHYAHEHNYQVVAEFQDGGCSGASLDRPGLTGLRAMIQRGEVEVLIVQNPDRLSRNVDHTLLLLSEVQEAEIELHTVTHGHLSQAKQPLPETLEAGIAECEQELPPFCRLDSEPTSGA